MTEEQRSKLHKIYELVNRGATEGEKQAAKAALDRFLNKHNLDESVLNGIELKKYVFKYTTDLELKLLQQIMYVMVDVGISRSTRLQWLKQIHSNLTYMDWITIESSYEYFRRHMKKEWKRIVAPVLNKCRKAKSKIKKRKELAEIFFSTYVINSKLYKDGDIKQLDADSMSKGEMQSRMMMRGVEGGSYNRQVVGTLLLEN